MARKIEYSKSNALTQATKLFLRKGYEATPMDELVKATGINRHSMYKEFGDKEGLFLACIKHYTLEQRNLKTVEILTQKPLGIKNVEAFLQDRVDYALCDDCYGCLLVNMITEREVVSQKVNDKIDRILTNQENLIFKCIEAAIEGGQISKDNDSRLVTDYLSCFFKGLMNMARNPNKNKCSLKKMGFMALTSIER